MFKRIFRLAGVTRGDEDRQKNIKMWGCEDIASFALVREPGNPSDPKAIRVELAGDVLGYIPRPHAKEIAPMMDRGKCFTAYFVCLNKHPDHETVGLTVRVEECPCQEAA